VSQEMFYTTAYVSKDECWRQWFEIEMRACVIDRVCQILSGIRQRTVQVEHHQVNRSFHQRRISGKEK
jgi:hypothetical protein